MVRTRTVNSGDFCACLKFSTSSFDCATVVDIRKDLLALTHDSHIPAIVIQYLAAKLDLELDHVDRCWPSIEYTAQSSYDLYLKSGLLAAAGAILYNFDEVKEVIVSTVSDTFAFQPSTKDLFLKSANRQ